MHQGPLSWTPFLKCMCKLGSDSRLCGWQHRSRMSAAKRKAYPLPNYGVAKELPALITDYVEHGERKAKFGPHPS
jgi:hypothetical protein